MSASNFLSAPLLWIVLPAFAGVIFWFSRRRFALVIFLSTALCLFLALLAWVLPIEQPVRLGAVSFTVGTTLDFAGRKLVLDSADRSFLIFVYLLCAFWFAGSFAQFGPGSDDLQPV